MAEARLRLDLSYDGTDFSGWAAQPGRRTVAGVLAEGLVRLFGPVSGLTVAGRTDAGVHATGQVCHVDVPVDRWRELRDPPVPAGAAEVDGAPGATGVDGAGAVAGPVDVTGVAGAVDVAGASDVAPGAGAPPAVHRGRLIRRLAAVLPPDVRVHSAVEAPPGFDARFSALCRGYEYRVTDAPYGAEPLRRRDTLAWPRPLDEDRLAAASAGLLGEHDFAAYCRRKENATTIREVRRLDWRRRGDGVLVAAIEADAFCQAMVRSLMGALLVTGDGRRPVPWPAGLLARRERASEVTVVPPHGLTLVSVSYPADPAGYAERAERTRRLRTPAAG